MHVLQIETIAEGTPCLVINLCPLLRIIDRHLHVGEVNRLFEIGLALRQIGYIKTIPLDKERLLATGIDAHTAIGHLLLLLFLQVETLCAALAEVIHRFSIGVEVGVATPCQRQFHGAIAQAFEVDANVHSALCLLFLSRLSATLFQLIILLQEGRGGIIRQQCQVDTTHIGISMVPLRLAIDRVEIAVGGKHQVFAIGTENRRGGVIPFVGHGMFLLPCDVIHIDSRHLVLGGA